MKCDGHNQKYQTQLLTLRNVHKTTFLYAYVDF